MPAVEVHGGSPLLRHGVIAALGELGLTDRTAPDKDPHPGGTQVMVVYTVTNAEDWHHLATLSRRRGVLLVVLLPDEDTETASRAYQLGASVVLSNTCSPQDLRAAVSDALAGVTRVSADLLRNLVTASATSVEQFSVEETRWLQLLAKGAKIRDVANEAGYSERMMFRLLRDLYAKLGVAGKVEALVKAQQLGFLGAAATTDDSGPSSVVQKSGQEAGP